MSFFEMGGYATYVWPAFGAAAAIMVALLVLSIRTMRAREATLRALEASARQRRDADGDGDSDGEQNAPA
ncbi:MAG: heme exporter protein CcmD [Rhodospirillaceae bacterium]|nr:heme exporter protein CcmD [Rhodospirillaceae bacterium]